MVDNAAGSREVRRFVASVGLALVAWAALAGGVPLTGDEAWYWAWSKDAARLLPDHPPGVAALIGFSTGVLGDGPLGVRAPGILFALGLAVVMGVGSAVLRAPAGFARAFALGLWAPGTAVLACLAVPDTGLTFFWALAVGLGLAGARGKHNAWYLAEGMAAGAALWFKLTAILYLPCLAAEYVYARRRGLPYDRAPEAFTLGFAAVALPALVVRYVADPVLAGPPWAHYVSGPGGAWAMAGVALGAVLFLGPALPVQWALAARKSAAGAVIPPTLAARAVAARLWIFFAGPAAVLTLAALFGRAEANWAAFVGPLGLWIALSGAAGTRPNPAWGWATLRSNQAWVAGAVLVAMAGYWPHRLDDPALQAVRFARAFVGWSAARPAADMPCAVAPDYGSAALTAYHVTALGLDFERVRFHEDGVRRRYPFGLTSVDHRRCGLLVLVRLRPGQIDDRYAGLTADRQATKGLRKRLQAEGFLYSGGVPVRRVAR